MKTTIYGLLTLSALTLGCRTAAMEPGAMASLESRSGSTARGTATMKQRGDGVAIHLDITGVTPGVHGIHIHEKGDCSAADASSAGAHYNPMAAPHGGPSDPMRHAGDFGNVTADASGTIRTDVMVSGITISDGPASAIGKALVLHASPDDLTTQPSGNAGARVACGVVTLANAGSN